MNKNTLISFGVVIALVLVMVMYSPKDRQDFSPHGASAQDIQQDSETSGEVEVEGSTDVQESDSEEEISENNIEFAPDFTLETFDGGETTLSEFRGEKPVILDFWASWCHNCQRALPKTEKLYEQYGDQVEIIAVNLNETEKAIGKYLSKEPLSFPVALDRNTVNRMYGIQYTNTHVFISKEGVHVGTKPGDLTEEDILALIEL